MNAHTQGVERAQACIKCGSACMGVEREAKVNALLKATIAKAVV